MMQKKQQNNPGGNVNAKIGHEISFEAQEAYNLLRTNLSFSFADVEEGKGKVIGVTSAMRGDGKSLSTINTAYYVANSGCKTLLIECDLRLPTAATNLALAPTPGLSNCLVGRNKPEEIIQKSGVHDNLFVITSGDIPPMPSELLASDTFTKLVDRFRGEYDYIFLDMPPLSAVSDALVVSNIVDGMLMVVRQNYTDRRALLKAMHQFEYAETRVIGFIFNCVTTGTTKYYRKYGKYSRYGRYGKYGKYGKYSKEYYKK